MAESFFKSKNPDGLYQWYELHLGIQREANGQRASFECHDAKDSQKKSLTVWSIFPGSAKYFDPSRSGFMINYLVDDLDGLLQALKEEGVEIDPHRPQTGNCFQFELRSVASYT